MEDLIQYILSEVKANRIEKQESLKLLSQLKLPYYYSKSFQIISLSENQKTYEYSCTLSQYDSFIVDHIVNNNHILPGAVYLELTRTAYLLCNKEAENISFTNIVWLTPMIVDRETIQVHIRITQEEMYSYFEISSIAEDGDNAVHCQGRIQCIGNMTWDRINLDSYISKEVLKKISRADCYEEFKMNGFNYGISHKVIEELLVSEQVVLARLLLPSFLNCGLNQYFLHPSILDAAFQAAIGFEYNKKTSFVPFSIDHMEVMGKCSSNMWAMITKDDSNYNERIHKMNMKLLNSEGKVIIKIDGFSYKNNEKIQISKEEQMENILKELLAKTIKLPVNRIRAQDAFDNYGMDSVLILKMTKELEKEFGPLSKTLFFENTNIEELAQYFIEHYNDRIQSYIEVNKEKILENKVEIRKEIEKEIKKEIKKKVTEETEETEDKMADETKDEKEDGIAIVGIAGRYPEADTLEEFWSNLIVGKDSISQIPSERWDHRFFYDERKDVEGKTYAKWGGFLSDVDAFDAFFFHISPNEAERMDPQERLFLECVYHSIEDAGYTRDTLDEGKNNVGVFVGVMYEEYQLYGAEDTVMGNPVSLSGSNASIANRISYYCDFHGPSIAMDTMCSSSLTAIHLACQMLNNGDCNVAIAGGVNVSVHPNKFIMLAQDHFASSKGRCESFGSDGDGYVPSEGVGAIILKPLWKAIQDQDHIYGVIKGTAINHGGKTNGYSVPSPKAQENVIAQALHKARINPRTISYIEAHGTGTSLGDPIEITGLTNTFKEYTKEHQFCSIGSVKSNIGHCESAAGIAGITKILLQMKYKKLVPSIHSKQLNPNIDFEQTPFFVQQNLTDWVQPTIRENGTITSYPLRAGISSFGAGGSNAHVIIEEYEEKEEKSDRQEIHNSKMIVLSARNEKQLKEVIRLLLSYIQEQSIDNDDILNSLAYTLAVGREAKEERIGLIVRTIDELKDMLQAYLNQQDIIDNFYSGNVYDLVKVEEKFVTKQNKEQTITHLLEQKDLNSLIKLWSQGIDIKWGNLFKNQKVKRLSLPFYPFEKKRYWYPKKRGYGEYKGEQLLHPLVHKNISTFAKQQFNCHIMGNELVIDGHRINNEQIVPGAVYIEMVIAALHLSLSKEEEEAFRIRLEEVYWITPVSVEQAPKDLVITLEKKNNQAFLFSVTVIDKEETIVCEGRASLLSEDYSVTIPERAIQFKEQKKVITKEECYDAFKKNQLCYGKNFQCIESIEMDQSQLIAQVKLDASIKNSISEYWLHPLLLDSAFQSVVGFYKEEERLMLPFFVESIDVMQTLKESMKVEIHKEVTNTEEERFHICLLDKENNICCDINGFLLKEIEKKVKKVEVETENSLLVANQIWSLSNGNVISPGNEWEKRYVIYADDSNVDIKQDLSSIIVNSFSFDKNNMEKCYEEIVLSLFHIIKECMISRPKKDILIQVVIAHDSDSSMLNGLVGMIKTATIENPKIKTQLIEINKEMEADRLLKLLEADSLRLEDTHIRYTGEERYVQIWKEEQLIAENPCKDNGVYLITGGCGGLGFLFAKEIINSQKNISLILTGRSSYNDQIQNKLDELSQNSNNVTYMQADISNKQEVQRLIESILSRYKKLNGIIHSAGITRDNFIIRKSDEEFLEVLNPKVKGTIYLDEFTKDMELDFFILFGSGTGKFGNVGQVDYAAANGFMDAFAMNRNNLVEQKQRKGRTISIEWPLWKDGGMHVNQETERSMSEEMGLALLDTQVGIKSFYWCYGTGKSQLFVALGNKDKIRTVLLNEGNDGLVSIVKEFAEYLHIEWNEVDENVALYEFGLDDIDLIGFIQAFNKMHNKKINSETVSLENTLLDIYEKLLIHNEDDEILQINVTKKIEVDQEDQSLNQNRKKELKQVEVFIKKLLSPIVKLPFEEIDSRIDLENYGLNSIMVLKFNKKLEEVLGQVSKTLLYECKNIKALAEYLLKTYKQQLYDKKILDIIPSIQETKIENVIPDIVDHEEDIEVEQYSKDDIAIIGLAGRYPKSRNMKQFWENLEKEVDCIVEIPQTRWNHSEYYTEDKDQVGKTYGKWGGFLEEAYGFDPEFFHITPREAYLMDPQERLFLQCAYETVEDAGYTKQSIKDANMDVGVYVGVMYDEYQMYSLNQEAIMESSAMIGNIASVANRVSYFFDFNGPSIALNTMCSSSLTTIHLACQSLILQECDMAIAGGVNLSVHPNKYLALGQGRFLSSIGRCQAFGEGGDGYVPGEGVGSILLKPLKKALKDRDHIYGIIKGSAINHGGKTNGYTVPNPTAQAKLIKKVYDKAKVNPRWLSYIEAHGTGTLLGDPIEVNALKTVFEESTEDRQFCSIGSVKSNIGHCESAAGIAAISKVLLQFKEKKIAASLYSKVLNNNIDFNQSPFYVQQSLSEWKRPIIDGNEINRYAGVSAFGAGGSNAHIILEEFDSIIDRTEIKDSYSIVISARDQDGLYRQANQLLNFIKQECIDDSRLLSMSYTLLVGREQMKARLALLCSSVLELAKQLEQFINHVVIDNCFVEKSFELSELTFDYNDEDEIKSVVNQCVDNNNETELLKLWVSGVNMDFKLLFKEPYPEKMSLPTYSFNNRPFFINHVKKQYTQKKVEEVKPLQLVKKYIRKEKLNQEKVNGMGKIKLEEVSIYKTPYVKEIKHSIVEEEQIRKFLVESLANVLYMDITNINIEQKFVDLGLDSVVGVEWIKLINQKYTLKLAATKIYDYPTVKDFTKLLVEQLNICEPVKVVESREVDSDSVTGKLKKATDEKSIESRDELEDELVRSLANVLYMEHDQIHKDKKFVDLGLDSVVGVEWIKWINKNYGTKIPATKIYDFPTIKGFAKYLSTIIPTQEYRSEEKVEEREAPDSAVPKKVTQEEGNVEGEKGLVLHEVGSIEHIKISTWNVGAPKANEIRIEVKASAINYPDIMCINGIYPTIPEYPFVPGFEVAGIITEVGNAVSGYSVGDEVIAVTGPNLGGHSDYVNVVADEIVRKPTNISFEEACSLPIVFATVAYALEVGRIKEKDRILIQAATGGIGLMALQFAHLYHCTTYGTSSKTEKIKILEQLGLNYVYNYVTDPFEKQIQENKDGGVDIVLNTLSGEVIQRGLQSLAPSGRYLELAVHGLKVSKKLDLSMLVNNQSFLSIDLRKMALNKEIHMKDYLEKMVQMVEEGAIVPIVSKIYPMNKIKEAMQYVSKGKHIGKVVISHQKMNIIDLQDKCLSDINSQKNHKWTGKSLESNTVVDKHATKELVTDSGKRDSHDFSLESIAIIGMDGIFPDADNVEDFFTNLMQGKDSVCEIPKERFDIDDYYDEDHRAIGKTYSRWMGHLKGIYEFDPLFFNISPAEAQLMDPQQRLFLQSCWRCFEDAGLKDTAVEGSKCGVFVGCAGSDYGIGMEEENYTVQSLLGQSTSILAARIAYMLNLVGPCLSIETACSSSLVAIAEACNNLTLHNCDTALAGGVYTISSPLMHIRASKAGMLSPDGKCHTFDNAANGFVPGEGVGTLLLKRLSDAERDHDQIYGVIRGWGVNQDGKTNGITAPSVQSQIELEKEIYKKFHINPESITMVEAHGTGTKLGDPIEVEALTTAFREFTNRKNYCALGSVKTNIGHLLMAAGVASVIKILQSLRYKKIPGLVHYHQLNEHITLEDSPFYINKDTIDWKTTDNEKRMAAVSAFGFSGTNAHIVIEEYEQAENYEDNIEEIDKLFVLSANSEKQLREYSRAILNYIESHKNISMSDINYTLKVGRNTLSCSMVIYAESKEDLITQLKNYWSNSDNSKYIKKLKTPMLNQAVNNYISGSMIPWEEYYDYKVRRRIHLPGYPFLKEIYYTERNYGISTQEKKCTKQLDPLHYEHTTILTGEESFLQDHKIGDDKVLPASAYIELVAKEMKHIAGNMQGNLRLSNLLWKQSIVVHKDSVPVKLSITRAGEAQYQYEITNESEKTNICCKGDIGYMDSTQAKSIDIMEWSKDCYGPSLSHEQCYAMFKQAGMNYGITHQGIQEIIMGKDKACVKLKIDDPQFYTYSVHPGLLDSALQAIIGFSANQEKEIGQIRVIAIGEIVVINNCQESMTVLIYKKDNHKFDAEIYDTQGRLCITIYDVELHIRKKKETHKLYMGTEGWESVELDSVEKEEENTLQRTIFCGFDNSNVCDKNKNMLAKSMVIECNIDNPSNFMDVATTMFENIKNMIDEIGNKKVRLQLLVPFKEDGNFYRAFYSLMKTIMLEKPAIRTQIIELDEKAFSLDLEELVRLNSYDYNHIHIQYRNGVRYVKRWNSIDMKLLNEQTIFRNNGVYLLIGGAKGVGLLFAKEIIQQTVGATLILVGKSEWNHTIEKNIEKLNSGHTKIIYESVDVCSRRQVQQLYNKIKEKYGAVNGILFGAGIIKDHLFVRKSVNEYSDVIRPKVEGVIHVDEIFSDEKLDFFLLFSSIASCIGNVGQADYALANGFLNEYASYRNHLIMKKERYGHTVAMDWSLWEDGGFQLDGREELKRANLSTKRGLQSVYLAYATNHNAVIAMEGDTEKIEKFWNEQNGNKKEAFYREMIELIKQKMITKEEFKRRLINQRW